MQNNVDLPAAKEAVAVEDGGQPVLSMVELVHGLQKQHAMMQKVLQQTAETRKLLQASMQELRSSIRETRKDLEGSLSRVEKEITGLNQQISLLAVCNRTLGQTSFGAPSYPWMRPQTHLQDGWFMGPLQRPLEAKTITRSMGSSL